MADSSVLRLDGVSKLYSGETPFLALDSISLDIMEGELIAIVGPSGSGKSTLLHMLGLLDLPTSGEIYVRGKKLSALKQDEISDIRRDTIGFVFQAFNLASTLSVYKNVELSLMISDFPKALRASRVNSNLSAVGMLDKSANLPSQLSGGQKQRAAIARALVNEPKIVLADEPTGNLDSKSSEEVMKHIISLSRDRGITVIIVTHDHALAQKADRIIRIMDGKIESDTQKGVPPAAASKKGTESAIHDGKNGPKEERIMKMIVNPVSGKAACDASSASRGFGALGVLFLLSISLIGTASAASGALVQVDSYSTVPSDVYPGTFGYLQIKLSNDGTATAKSVSAYYYLDGISKSTSIGDIGVGSSAELSIPFIISQSAAGSIQILDVNLYYSYESGSSLLPQSLSVSIPLTVNQYKPLEVSTLSVGESAIAPGEGTSFQLSLKNNGGVINNLIISMPENSTFTIDGASQKAVGSIPLNSSANATLSLVSSSSAKIGSYGIPVVFTYQDALRQPTEETIQIGPVNVLDSSSQYRISLQPLSAVEIGAQVPVRITLENTGSSPMSGTIDINKTDTFTPIGVQRVYFDEVPAGKSVSADIVIGVLATQSAGYYTLPITLSPNAGQSATYNAGIAVAATPEVTITLDSTSGTPSVQIANTGNSQIRSVYMSAKTAGSQSKTESFVGTLNVDDFASLSLASAGTARSVDVEVKFRDTNNEEHMLTQTLEIAGNSSFSGTGARTGSAAAGLSSTGAPAARSSNPLGMLFGGRAGASASSGPDIVLIGGGAIAVAVIGYFVYKRFFKAKKPAVKAPEPGKPAKASEGAKRQ